MTVDVGSDRSVEHSIPLEPAKEINLLDVLIVLSRRRRFIFVFTFVVAVITAIIVLVLPSSYTASTIVLPPSQNSSMSSALLNQIGSTGALASLAGASLNIKNSGDMYVSLFLTRTVQDGLIQRFGLTDRYHVKRMSDARKAFSAHSKVSLGTKDGLITISVTDKDPKFAAALANGYVDEFRKLSASLAITEASQRRAFFQQQLLEADTTLTNAEEAMKKTQETTGVVEVDSQARSLITFAAMLRAQISAKEVELQAIRSYATPDNPQMVVVTQQLDALRSELAKLSATDSKPSSDIIVPKGNIPQAGMEYLRKLRDLKYAETIVELISKQFELAKLDEARQGAIIQVADVAIPPDARSFPKRTITVIGASMLGFLLACAWCFMSNAISRLGSTPDARERIEILKSTFVKRPRAKTYLSR